MQHDKSFHRGLQEIQQWRGKERERGERRDYFIFSEEVREDSLVEAVRDLRLINDQGG